MSKYKRHNVKNEQDQNQTKPRKAVLFARVSTSRQGREGLSLGEVQIPRMREYAKEHNLEIEREYKVSETGGRQKKRKKFDEMIKYVKENDFITDIIAFRVDRITRNFSDAVVIDDLRSQQHIQIHFIDDNFILDQKSGSNELFQWDAKVLFARQQLERLKEDGINSKITKLSNGELPWPAPYGYKNQKHVPPEQRVIPIEPEAGIVREIFEEFATGKYSCRSLAAEMQMRYGGIGQKFDHKKIWTILRDPFYKGKIYDDDTDTWYSHIHPTLITPEIFERCGEILDNDREAHCRSYSNKVPAIYRGCIKCSECGCDVIPDFKDKKQKNGNIHHYNYYHCSNTKSKHQMQRNITEESISDRVRKNLSKMTLPTDRIQTLSDRIAAKYASKTDFYKNERAKLAKQRGLIKQRQRNTYDDMADRVISRETYDENNRRYQEELAKIQEEEERLECTDEAIYTTPKYLQELIRHIETLFNAGRFEEKRKILNILFEVIRLDGENIEPVIKPELAPYFK